jgi:osmotically-inducible protein OsmY
MSESQEPDAPQYAVARLNRALAEDPRTAELGVRVTVRGDQVFLRGEVPSEARRGQLAQVVRERAPDLRVHNDVRVMCADEPSGREELR